MPTLRSLRCLLFKQRVVPFYPTFPRSISAVQISRYRRSAFTLLELLVVITIIAILLGLLYGAIHTVGRFSRETITRGELSNIEAAWKQYYNYYHTWPTNNVENASSSAFAQDATGDVQHEIGPLMARMLAGASTNAPGFSPLNWDGVPFLELTRFDNSAAPINAWGVAQGKRYFVKLDVNGDNTLMVPTDTSADPSHTTNIFRRVAVWTATPANKLIGSWMQ